MCRRAAALEWEGQWQRASWSEVCPTPLWRPSGLCWRSGGSTAVTTKIRCVTIRCTGQRLGPVGCDAVVAGRALFTPRSDDGSPYRHLDSSTPMLQYKMPAFASEAEKCFAGACVPCGPQARHSSHPHALWCRATWIRMRTDRPAGRRGLPRSDASKDGEPD